MKSSIKSLILLVLTLLTSCIDENPDLVNPKPQNETEHIRLLNFAGDKEARTLNMNSTTNLGPVQYDNTSAAVNPPADSIIAAITKNGSVEIKLSKKIKFLRESFYTAACLPTQKYAKTTKAVDTVVYFSTSIGLTKNTVNSYLKVFNAYPDTTCTYSVTLGCPNGLTIAAAVSYKQVSSQYTVRAGSVPVSLMRNTSAGSEILGLFDLNLTNDYQYTIVISEDADGKAEFRLLNEMSSEVTALYPAEQIYEKTAYVRTVNFSTEQLDIKKIPDELIEAGASANFIGYYKPASACGSGTLDSVAAYYGTFMSSVQPLSLNVNDRYTFFTLDTKDKKAGQSYMIQQAKPDYLYNKLALVRVINANADLEGVTLSVGARQDTGLIKYSAGEVIGSKINYSKVSGLNNLYIGDSPQTIPLSLFTSSQPGKLVLTTKAQLEAGKSYVFVVYKNAMDKPALYVIEETQENMQLQELPNMQFMQFVSLDRELSNIDVTYSNILNEAKVQFATGFATISEIGANTISLNGYPFSFDVSADYRNVLIATGNASNIELINLPTAPLSSPMAFSQQRFVNAAKDLQALTVRIDSDTGTVAAENLNYLSASEFKTEKKERSFSFFFLNSSTNEVIFRLNEVSIIQGKSYTFILGGSKEKGYTVYIVQDY